MIDPAADPPRPAPKLRPDQARKIRLAERDYGIALRAAGFRAQGLANLYSQTPAAAAQGHQITELEEFGRQLRALADDFHPIRSKR